MSDQDARKPTQTVRHSFTHGRTRAIVVPIRKPDRPPPTPDDFGQRMLARLRKDAEEAAAAKVKAVNERLSNRFPAVRGRTVTLSKEHPRACLLTHGDSQHRLLVAGCGHGTARKKKKVVVEMHALGLNSRLDGAGITCDGEKVLPRRTVQVRVELLDAEALVDVTVEPRPPGSRKKYGPKRWIKRRFERPIEGRWRRPKPTI